MSRTFMMVVLVLSIVTISYADETFNRSCMSGNQQTPMIQDCENSNYQTLIREKAKQTEELLYGKAKKIDELLDKIAYKSRHSSFFPHDFYSAQRDWESYFDKMVRIRTEFIERTGKGSTWGKKRCLIDEVKFDLLSLRLSYLDGEMRFLCQFYSQAFMHQKQTEGKQGKPSSSLLPATGFTIKKQN